MNKKRINNKGITLITMIITIIVLIILAAISINFVIGENGIITQASKQKILQEIAQITERLELKKTDVALESETGSVPIDDYIKEVLNNDKMVYKVTDVDRVDKENAYITVEGKYEYLLEQEENGNLKIIFQGEVKKLSPRIQNLEISSSTNEIEVKVIAKRAEKYVFYIKEKGAQEYTKKEENETAQYIYKGLQQNKQYTIKVEAINKNGQDEREVNRLTGEMVNLTQAEVKYVKSNTNWTNKNVTTKIEINTQKDISNYEIQYAKFAEGEEVTSEKLTNANWQKYTSSGIISEENETIYTRLNDGYNVSSYTSTTIANIDKIDANITTGLSSSNVTTKGFTLNIEVKDEKSGLGKIKWYYKLSTADNYSNVEDEYTVLNGTVAGTKTLVNKTKTITDLVNGTYNVYAVVYDVAGNTTKSETIEVNLEQIGIAEATASPTTWTNGSVTITLPISNGFTTQYQIGTLDENGTWINYSNDFTVSNNTTVYYRYYDGTNGGSYASKTISNIDTLEPGETTVTYVGGSNTHSWNNNYNINLSSIDASETTYSGKSGISYYEIDIDGDGTSDTTTGSNFIPENGYDSCNTKFRAVDAAGNRGAWTEVHHIHMDTTAPTAPSVPDLITDHDTGSSSTDNITKWWYNVQIQGTAEPGMTINLRIYNISSDIVGVGTADANGNWVIPINLHENEWNHIYAWSVDSAGNFTQQSEYLAVYCDTTAPSTPIVTYNGGSNTCSWKNNYNITLSSTDATGIWKYQADHYEDGIVNREIGSNFVPENGYSTCTDRYRAVDVAGNEGSWTETQHIHMDTETPIHTSWWWGEVTKDVARLYIQATDNTGISRVQCPTSTQTGEYNNWHWFDTVWDESASAYRCDITPATFGHYGQIYKIRLYVYDHAGNGGYYNEASITIPSAQTVWDYGYTGGVQSFTAPSTGTYKLEVWGAQGGTVGANTGGLGGYAIGTYNLNQGDVIYLYVGGAGGSITGGYNGGGNGGAGIVGSSQVVGTGVAGGGGGGATHIAITDRGILSNYNDYRNEILIVAGGGGGATRQATDMIWSGGAGGGTSGGQGIALDWEGGTCAGGTQTSGYAFGLGATGCDGSDASWSASGSGGGGGGYYGGYANDGSMCNQYGLKRAASGAGGSGYIGGVTNGTTTEGQREGNGYARITIVQ